MRKPACPIPLGFVWLQEYKNGNRNTYSQIENGVMYSYSCLVHLEFDVEFIDPKIYAF